MKPFEHFARLQEIKDFPDPRFYLGRRHVGWIKPELVDAYQKDEPGLLVAVPGGYTLNADTDTNYDTRTAALARCFDYALKAGLNLDPPHGELLPITPTLSIDNPLAGWDRNSGAFFSTSRGVAVTVYTIVGGEKHIWTAQRGPDRRFFPNLWDSLVSGGLQEGKNVRQIAEEESYEEAGIPPELLTGLTPAPPMAYANMIYGYPYIDVWYPHDLEVPNSFRPLCTDGSVQAYRRFSPAEMAVALDDPEKWRLDSTGTMLDFCLRHNVFPIAPEDRQRINGYFRRELPFDPLPLR